MEPNQSVQSVESTAPTYTYAGFWWRFLAYIIDGLIVNTIIFFPMMLFFVILGGILSYTKENSVASIIAVVFTILISFGSIAFNFLYFAWFESSQYQATPGKKVLGMIVTDEKGYKLSFKQAFLRNVCKIVSGLTLDIGYVIAAFTEKNQALHDLMAKTLVLKRV